MRWIFLALILSGCAGSGDADHVIDNHFKVKFCAVCINLDWDHKSTHDIDESEEDDE